MQEPDPEKRVRAGLTLLAVTVLAVGLTAYRAATQAVVHDEALTALEYVSGPWAAIFTRFDANNHVLFTLAAKLSVSVFGMSAFTLRLPSVMAEAVWLYLLAQLCRRYSGIGPWAFAAIAWNPMLLDFAAAARGYQMGLMFLAAGWWWAKEHPVRAGLAFGLAVASNLTIAVPAAVIGLMLIERKAWAKAAAAGLGVAVLILGRPLLAAQREMFYYGADTVGQWMESLVRPMLRHSVEIAGPMGWEMAVTVVQWIVGPTLGWLLWRRGKVGLILGASVAVLMAAHWVLGVKYPLDRTGLYLVPLFLLAVFEAAPARVGMALAGLLIAQNASQVGVRHFVVWWYDAAAGEAMERVCAGARAGARLRTQWLHQPALEFARRQACPERVLTIERRGDFAVEGADYYAASGVPLPGKVVFDDRGRSGLLVVAGADFHRALAGRSQLGYTQKVAVTPNWEIGEGSSGSKNLATRALAREGLE